MTEVVFLTAAITLSIAVFVGLFVFSAFSEYREKSFQHQTSIHEYRLRELESECWRQRRLADHYRERCRKLRGEMRKFRTIVETHDLCHNLEGKVDATAFADGCADKQREVFDCAPDRDKLNEALRVLRKIEWANDDGVRCPMCDGSDPQHNQSHPGHYDDCQLRAVLSQHAS